MAEDYYHDEEEEYEGPPIPLFWKILGKTIKYTAIGIIVFINLFLLWRVFFSTNEPSAIKSIAGNSSLSSAYEAYVIDGDPQKPLFAVYQAEKDNIGTNEDWRYPTDPPVGELKDNTYAQFFLTEVIFFPYADQAQVVLRYNKSSLDVLAKDYELESAPAKSEEVFDVTLVVVYKPSSDSAEKATRIKATLAADATTSLYSFWQYSFEDLPEFESITDMAVEIYYKGDVDYSERAYSSIDVYDNDLSVSEYQLDKKDKAALEKAK